MTREIEYRVRPVTRYIVTRYHSDTDGGPSGVETIGEFDNLGRADVVGAALANSEQGASFATIEDRREPIGIFTAHTSEEADALMDFIHGPNFPRNRS